MKEKKISGTGYYATICPSHLTRDPEFRRMFKPGEVVYYYPETIEIQEGIVFIGAIPVSSEAPEMVAIQMAKLQFSSIQFSGLLKTIPGLYQHYLKVIKKMEPSIGSKRLSHGEVHQRLKKSCLSAANTLSVDDFISPADEENYIEIGIESAE